jgi:hypothetical protein
MAFSDVLNTLKQEEEHLARQLSNVRAAITALGSNIGYVVTGRGRKPGRKRWRPGHAPALSAEGVTPQYNAEPQKRRKMSAKARNAISKAQKLRWARQKAAAK